MNNTLLIIVVTAWLGVISQLAIQFGVTTSFLQLPTTFTPLHGSGFLAIVDGFMTVAVWIINNVASIMQILTFQVNINPYANLMLFTPIALGFVYLVLKLVRG